MSTTILLDGRPLPVSVPPTLSGNFPRAGAAQLAGVEDLLLGSLQHPFVRLRREMHLKVRRSSGRVTISWDEADLSAEAPSFTLALDRFRRVAAEQFLLLQRVGKLSSVYANAMSEGRV